MKLLLKVKKLCIELTKLYWAGNTLIYNPSLTLNTISNHHPKQLLLIMCVGG